MWLLIEELFEGEKVQRGAWVPNEKRDPSSSSAQQVMKWMVMTFKEACVFLVIGMIGKIVTM